MGAHAATNISPKSRRERRARPTVGWAYWAWPIGPGPTGPGPFGPAPLGRAHWARPIGPGPMGPGRWTTPNVPGPLARPMGLAQGAGRISLNNFEEKYWSHLLSHGGQVSPIFSVFGLFNTLLGSTGFMLRVGQTSRATFCNEMEHRTGP